MKQNSQCQLNSFLLVAFLAAPAISTADEIQPSNEKILACHERILSIKSGMKRKQVEEVASRYAHDKSIYKDELYVGCSCDVGILWSRHIWFKPSGMPSSVYQTINEYENWIKQNKNGISKAAPDDVVVALSDAICEPLK